MVRFKINIIITDNGERVILGFADPNGNFYPFNSMRISNFDLALFWEYLSIQFVNPTLSYDNFDTSYSKYLIKESDEIFLEEFVYI